MLHGCEECTFVLGGHQVRRVASRRVAFESACDFVKQELMFVGASQSSGCMTRRIVKSFYKRVVHQSSSAVPI